MDKIEEYLGQAADLIIAYGGSVVLAILTLIIGLWIVKRMVKVFNKTMQKSNVEASLRPFLVSIVGTLLRIMLVISVAGIVGIEMTSFVAVLGAAGLAVGLALQGSLSNFAGGVLILLLKPFKVGDYIEAGGVAGTVREIQIFYTYITTLQNQEVIIPNGDLSNSSVKNYSFHDIRRIDLSFGIGYTDDIDKAKSILTNIAKADPNVLKDQEIDVFLEELGDSSVNFNVRVWTKTEDFWTIVNGFPEKVKKAFDEAGVGIPYPQMDVHLFPNEPAKA